MTKIEELDIIANRIVENGDELPVFATLGIDAWKQLWNEVSGSARYSFNEIPDISGFRQMGAHLGAGSLTIKPSLKVPPDFVGIGRITLNDIIIEDILLDDETYAGLDTDS